jgi:hypothetical protein
MADSTADLEAQYNSSMHQERGSLLTHPELPPWIQTPSLALATPSEKNQSTHKGDTLEVEPDIWIFVVQVTHNASFIQHFCHR